MPHLCPRVAIVDDDDLVRAFFEDVLREDGYECRSFSRGPDALAELVSPERWPDLFLSDIRMQGMSGLDFLRALRQANCPTPVILISGYYDLPSALDAMGEGAADYLLKPALPEDILAAVAKHIVPNQARNSALLTAEAAFSLDLCNLTDHAAGTQLRRLANSLAEKRTETLEHSRRVASYALLTGKLLGGVDLRELELGAMLHDIGKVGVPENVLNKAGPLNTEEWRIMKLHPAIGRDILIPVPGMEGIAEFVYCHHEYYDGTGYPRGLAANGIMQGARIFSVADAFDAMTSDRSYRSARPISVARIEIQRMSGSQFDPDVVKHFLSVPEQEIEVIMRLHSERIPPGIRRKGVHVVQTLHASALPA